MRRVTLGRALGLAIGVELILCASVTLGVGFLLFSNGRVTW